MKTEHSEEYKKGFHVGYSQGYQKGREKKNKEKLVELTKIPPIEPVSMPAFWIPITYRPMDEEEYEEYRKEFGELPVESRKMFSCQMPEDDQEILICTSWGGVSQDRCEIDEYGYALETQGDWDGVTAWMPLPKAYMK